MYRKCTLMEQYIRLIAKGLKTIEARIATHLFLEWESGDTIKFFSRRNPNIFIVVKITAIKSYKDFREMLENENIEKLIRGATSIEEGVQIYRGIPGYAAKEEKGILVFYLEVDA